MCLVVEGKLVCAPWDERLSPVSLLIFNRTGSFCFGIQALYSESDLGELWSYLVFIDVP